MPTSIKDAIKIFEEKKQCVAAEAKKVELYGMCPPIDKMDATLASLKACEHLSLSTNNIDKISGLSGLENLKILSLGRNLLKKIEGLDAVAGTLEEFWLSYNVITSTAGLEKCANLRVLYLSNNKIAGWGEVERLAPLSKLEELLLVGNPLYNDNSGDVAAYRLQVIKRLPQLKKLDGIPVDVDERDAAKAL